MADDSIKQNTTSAMASAVSDMSPSAASATDDQFADTKNELVSRFELLPDDIKNAIMDTGYQQKLFDLAKSQKLTYEELGVVETETTMVLLGMTKPADYRDELQSELKKGDAEIDPIVKAVNEQIFAPIRASLERVYAAKKEPEDYIPDSIMTGVEEKPTVSAVAGIPTMPIPTALGTSVPIARVATPVMPASPAPFASAPKPAMPAAAPVIPPAPAPSFTTSIARPAVQSFTAPSSITSLEKNVLGAAGVVIDTPPTPAPSAPTSQIPDRAKLLASIENPSRIAPNMIADKLKAATPIISPSKTTDYSMPASAKATAGAAQTPAIPAAIPASTPAKPYVDPYREPI